MLATAATAMSDIYQPPPGSTRPDEVDPELLCRHRMRRRFDFTPLGHPIPSADAGTIDADNFGADGGAGADGGSGGEADGSAGEADGKTDGATAAPSDTGAG